MATETNMVQGNESNGIAPSILTVRMIMQGKEVGSIIGKKGDNIKRYREESGAKINISDGSCPERIVTITGTTDNIHKAFTMICSKFEEPCVFQDLQNTPTVPKPPVTLRLVVPASQCGSLIGKGGIKIKEIREGTGASIQVASEMLPNSTERAVTISGTAEAVTACIRLVCGIMLESPPKGATIPYRPKPAVPPVVYAGGQAFVIQSPQVAMPPPPQEFGLFPTFSQLTNHHPTELGHPICGEEFRLNKLNQMSIGQPHIPMMPPTTYLPVSAAPGYAPIPFQQRHPQNGPMHPNTPQTHEMNIPNDLIGCIIGRGGQKINEIRQLSGANIKISNAEEGCPDRKVTITGTPETISMAQYLINTSMELHKTLVLDPNTAATPPTSSANPTSATPVTSVTSPVSIQSHHAQLAMPLTLPAMKPTATLQYLGMGGINGIAGLNGVNGALNGYNFGVMDPLLMAGLPQQAMQQPGFTGKVRVGVATVKTGSPKFSPY